MFESRRGPDRTPDGYHMVGEMTTLGELSITYDDADAVRRAVHTFFDTVPPSTPLLSETVDKTVGGKGFHTLVGTSPDELPSIFSAALVKNYEQESWRMVLMLTRMGRSGWNNAPQRRQSQYVFEVVDQTLMEARKRVKVVRSIGELSAEVALGEIELEMQKKMFERPIDVHDCARIETALSQSAARYRAMNGRS